MTDNFYNGKVFQVGLKRYAPQVYSSNLTLKILPLQKDAPIYLPVKGVEIPKEGLINLPKVTIEEKYTFNLKAK